MKKKLKCTFFGITPCLFIVTLAFCTSFIVNAQETSWGLVTSPTEEYLNSVFMVSANDGWAVGDVGTIIRWDGTNWNKVNSGTTTGLKSLFMINFDDGWAVGEDGIILRWNGINWNQVESPTTDTLLGVFMLNSDDGWIVGYNGTILRWNGINWSLVSSPTNEYLTSVYMISSNGGWAVGYGGRILQWNGLDWKLIDLPTSSFNSVFIVSSNDGWAVGNNGTIVHWDGANWTIESSPTKEWFSSVFMVSASDGWAVGGGPLIHWDGISWKNVTSPTNRNLHSIFMVSSNDGWGVGSGGKIIRFTQETTALPNAILTTSPNSPEVGEIIIFDASGSSDSDGIIVNYSWVFGDGSIGNGRKVSHTYVSTGAYTVVLTVTDDDGLIDTETKIISFGNNENPRAVAGLDKKVEPGSIVTFDASESSDDVGIDGYEWDFGDGTTGTGVIAKHTYTIEGEYSVTLKVTDVNGNFDTTELVVTVGKEDVFLFLVLSSLILGIVVVIIVLFYLRKRKSKPAKISKMTEIPPNKNKTSEVISAHKMEELHNLPLKCDATINALNRFVDDPSLSNDKNAWKVLGDFITDSEKIEDDYAELFEIKNTIARLRRQRSYSQRAGLETDVAKYTGYIQSNYQDLIRIIKKIRGKFTNN